MKNEKNIKYINTLCRALLGSVKNFLVFVEVSALCILASFSVLYTTKS